jgi:hypothetical protein
VVRVSTCRRPTNQQPPRCRAWAAFDTYRDDEHEARLANATCQFQPADSRHDSLPSKKPSNFVITRFVAVITKSKILPHIVHT